MEAGAMGKAVIVSDSDGVREFVRDGKTGLVVPAHDTDALRAAIARLLADPDLCHRLGQGGRRFMEATAEPAVFAPRLAAAYRALAAG
jgi:glycosyltransferase involved in cell wall biosynthesis